MIFRKPFAILIKNFKLIHLFLAFLTGYMVYSTNMVLSFFNDYLNSVPVLIDHDISVSLFKPQIYLSLFLIFIVILIIVFLLAFKKKPIKFYLYSILTYIFVIVILTFSKDIISELEIKLMATKTLKLIQDLNIISIGLQVLVLLNVIITATGFNIKKFDFVKDLEELDITDVDNEEFEVNLEIDNEKLRRKIFKSKRYIYYVYKENKYVFLMLGIILTFFTSIVLYLNFGVYNKTYKENEFFETNEFVINIEDTYLTSTDYQNNRLLADYQFVVVKFKIRNIYNSLKYLKQVSLTLNINDHKIYSTNKYRNQFFDIGNMYKNEEIKTDYNTYIMVYQIPNSYAYDKMFLTYTDNNKKVTKIKIKPLDLNKKVDVSINELNTELVLKTSVLKETKVMFNSFDISKTYKENYDFCLDVCISSSEYIKAPLNKNNDMALLKLKGSITYDDVDIKLPSSIYDFLSKFGSLEYTVDGVEKTTKLNKGEVLASKIYNKDIAYIEVPIDAISATNATIVLNIKNKIYRYVLR